MDDFKLRNEPGWLGAFTRQQLLGVWKNGTRVVKTNSEPGDSQPDGTPGVVLGAISDPRIQDGAVCYFVEWASAPRVAVAVMASRIRPVRVV